MSFWDLYPTLHAYSVITILIVLTLCGLVLTGTSLFHPWMLVMLEFINNIPLPSWVTTPYSKQWLSIGIQRYFDHKLVYTKPKEEYEFLNKQYIKCFFPHGILPWGGGAIVHDPNEQDAFGLQKNTLAVSHHVFSIPFVSHIFKYILDAKSINLQSMYHIIEEKKSIMMCPGGVREMCASNHKKEVLLIRRRRGVFQLAIRTGTPLIPIYTFGLTQVYHRSGVSVTIPAIFGNDEETFTFQWGRWYTIFPLKTRLLTVVGKPIPVSKNEPTSARVSELRELFISSVQELFDTWKSVYDKSWGEKQLLIL